MLCSRPRRQLDSLNRGELAELGVMVEPVLVGELDRADKSTIPPCVDDSELPVDGVSPEPRPRPLAVFRRVRLAAAEYGVAPLVEMERAELDADADQLAA